MSTVRITLKQGILEGKCMKTIVNNREKTFYGFTSIPYAKPPLGDLRFKAPLPPEPWEDILDATKPPPKCYQPKEDQKWLIEGSEDCLYLNVFCPETGKCKTGGIERKKYAVMVFIHGGFFKTGSSNPDLYGPDYLVYRDVILVTINYRIGLLGFISFKDKTLGVPGNAGLKDQVMALKWIQENIRNFDGDPYNVTIFGHGAGAASVHLHVLSPMSKGLFHRAIMQSGCALNPWVNGQDGTGNLIGDFLNMEFDCEIDLIRELQKLPIRELYRAQKRTMNKFSVSKRWICSPVIETQTNEPAFLPKQPIDIILSGEYNHVPMIFGYTNQEGIFYDIHNFRIWYKSKLIKDFKYVIPNNINCFKSDTYRETIANRIKEFYYRESNDDPNVFYKQPLINLMTDIFYLRGIDGSVRNHIKNSQFGIWLYRFSFDGELNLAKNAIKECTNYARYTGAAHGDDLYYLFKAKDAPEPDYDTKSYISIMTKMWTNFAKCGDPTPIFLDKHPTMSKEWKPVRKCAQWFWNITNQPGVHLDLKPDRERMQFWDTVYKNDLRTKFL